MFDSDAAKETPAKIAEFYLSKPMKFIWFLCQALDHI